MYTSAQVIIDLEEYNDLKKKAEQFEKGSNTKKEDTLALMVSRLLEATSNASIGLMPDYSMTVINLAKANGYDITSEKGTICLTEIR